MKQLIILAALSLVLSCVSASYVKTITFNSIVGRNPEKNTILQTGVKVKARCGNSGPW